MDAMAIVRALGRPTYFVTFTCNPDWPEIRAALLPGQDAQSRPDLVARVFGQKLRALLEDLTKRGIFGRCVALLMVIEFQKRGKSDQNRVFFFLTWAPRIGLSFPKVAAYPPTVVTILLFLFGAVQLPKTEI